MPPKPELQLRIEADRRGRDDFPESMGPSVSGSIQTDRGRQASRLQALQAEGGLDDAGGAEAMSDAALHGADAAEG